MVPYRNATEKASNSATSIATSTYEIHQREYCYEEGSFRGAFSSELEKLATRVTRKRRKPTHSAFFFFRHTAKGLMPIRRLTWYEMQTGEAERD
jgi:hypothetical protein